MIYLYKSRMERYRISIWVRNIYELKSICGQMLRDKLNHSIASWHFIFIIDILHTFVSVGQA